LDALLQTYNLIGTVSFPTRKSNPSQQLTTYSFRGQKNYIIYPLINGLSDHEAQMLVKENIVLKKQRNYISITRDIDDQNIMEFQLQLSYENWEEIFIEHFFQQIPKYIFKDFSFLLH
jgi:hypothetical protein